MRFGESERRQVARAAALQGTAFSSYVRRSAIRSAYDDLEARARVEAQRRAQADEGKRAEEAPAATTAERRRLQFIDGEAVT